RSLLGFERSKSPCSHPVLTNRVRLSDGGASRRRQVRAHSSIGQSVRLINGWFLVRTQVGLPRAEQSTPARHIDRTASSAQQALVTLCVGRNSLYRHESSFVPGAVR